MRLRKVLVPAVALAVLAGTVVGCSSSGSGSDLVTANGTEPQHPLIPTDTNENGGGRIVDRLFAGLEYYDADGKPHNEVADSITSPDRKTWTITLKDGWTFSDGTPVTAKSFVDAWNYGALSSNKQVQNWAFADIAGADAVMASPPTAQTMSGLKVVDDKTFTVELTEPNIDFQLSLGFAPFYPLPAAFYRDPQGFGEHPIGNGPYMMAGPDAWQHNVALSVKPNPAYHGGRPARNKGLKFVFYQSLDTAYSDLQAGNLDLDDTVPRSALATFKQDLGDHAIEKPTAQNQHIGIQIGHAPHFTGPEGVLRRKAISLAVNREQIAQAIFNGTRIPAKDFTASSLPGFDGNLPGTDLLAYNPDRARQLWAQADAISPWAGKYQIAYNSDGDHQAWIDAVANSIKNTLGIDAEGAPYPTFKTIRDQITSHTFDSAFRYGWQGDYPSMLEFLTPQYLSTSQTNDVEYKNPEFDAALRAAQAAATPEESYRATAKAQALLLADMADIPLFDYVAAAGTSTKVTAAKLSWSGLFDYENVTG
ncbi:peptide ABC transporter substrate-binding protein [Nocardia stercoris]|uniref:peptide ABC transporter substrate-binding protein n=1 Tax=Nocardia stercoris TaxID=2483361 RepID=UPI002D78BC71|nr:ABC transporter substrate-binding protein [Nocardia stercoris]